MLRSDTWASCVCSVTVSFASLSGGIKAFWGRRENKLALCSHGVLSPFLDFSVFLEMTGVSGVRKIKAIQSCRDI